MNRIPVSEGDTLDVKIDSTGSKGDGIARVDGFVMFVKDGKQGDHVTVKVTKVGEKAAWAEVVAKVEKPKDPDEELLKTMDEKDFSEEF